MKNLCYNRGAEDNLTAVVIKAESVWVNEESDDAPTVSAIRPHTAAFAQYNKPNQSENFTPSEEFTFNQTFSNSNSRLSVPTNNSNDGAIFRVEGAIGVASDDDVRKYEQMQSERAYIIDHSRRESLIGRIFKAMFLIAFGAILGITGYYGLTDYSKKVNVKQEQNVPETVNLPYMAFEDNRRNADKNPRQYLEASGATADDAEDFYLLGRANLNLLNYKLAGENFRKAKELLPNTNETNRKVLENELNIALAMLADSDAVKRFEKERSSANQTTANTAISNEKPANANTKNINSASKPSTTTTKSNVSEKDG
jgi:hypothetical protein